jgi:hypothetical protein
MSEITPTNGKVEIAEEASRTEPEYRAGEEKRIAKPSRVEKIREELGIVDGHVTLTFLDDGI